MCGEVSKEKILEWSADIRTGSEKIKKSFENLQMDGSMGK